MHRERWLAVSGWNVVSIGGMRLNRLVVCLFSVVLLELFFGALIVVARCAV